MVQVFSGYRFHFLWKGAETIFGSTFFVVLCDLFLLDLLLGSFFFPIEGFCWAIDWHAHHNPKMVSFLECLYHSIKNCRSHHWNKSLFNS